MTRTRGREQGPRGVRTLSGDRSSAPASIQPREVLLRLLIIIVAVTATVTIPVVIPVREDPPACATRPDGRDFAQNEEAFVF